jgi:serine protease Do/serine protease DegQ
MNRKLFAIGAATIAAFASYPLIAADSPAIKAAIQVEDAFAEVVEMAKPAVVVITNKQTVRRGGFNNFQMDIPDNFFDFFGLNPRDFRRPDGRQQRNAPRIPEAVGSGSGVIVRQDGYIVTNYHVIKDCEYLEVKTSDGTVYDNYKDKDAVVVVGSDEESDLAVLKVGNGKKNDFACLEFADSDKLRVGQWAIAIGAPFSLDYSVTVGCVSQKGRTDMGMSTFDSYIQTDASINPGNSGGPLLDIHGNIIGINQFIVTGGNGSRGSVGIGFAISSNLAKTISNELIENGEIARPFLGITMQELNRAIKEELEITYGVLVRDVVPDCAAEKAGVQPGDVILTINGHRVMTSHELLMEVTKYKAGDVLELGVRRGTKQLTFKIKTTRRDDHIGKSDGSGKGRGGDTPSNAQNLQKRLGLELVEENGKVIVQDVIPGGAADRAGNDNEDKIMPDDIIIDINRIPVKSIADVRNVLKDLKKKTAILYLQRKTPRGDDYKYFIAVNIEEK